MYSEINELTYVIEELARANSQRQRLLAFDSLTQKIEQLPTLTKSMSDQQRLSLQLKVISQEAASLNQLIEQRLQSQQLMLQQQENLLAINNEIHRTEMLKDMAIAEVITSTFIQSNSALTYKRLHQVKQAIRLVSDAIVTLKNNPDLSAKHVELINKLEQCITGEDGLLSIKASQLRIIGRTNGRIEFVPDIDQTKFENFHLNSLRRDQ